MLDIRRIAFGDLIMPKAKPPKPQEPTNDLRPTQADSLIFISHDSRDAEVAEAFSKLLKSVSAGMLKTFRSSDQKGVQGIEFGDDWYKRLMERLSVATDVVCLFTERSLDRPWILYEAGVAKGKLNTPVHGIALGIPLSRVGTGPFYQFQNSDDSDQQLTKLVLQLARRIPTPELDSDVVAAQVKIFKDKAAEVLAALAKVPAVQKVEPEPTATATLFEEMKVLLRELPATIEERVAENVDSTLHRRRRRFHPMMLEDLLHQADDDGEPTALLFLFNFLRADLPCLYEYGSDLHRALTKRSPSLVTKAMHNLQKVLKFATRHPLAEELTMTSRDSHMILHELPRMMERYVNHYMRRRLRLKGESAAEEE